MPLMNISNIQDEYFKHTQIQRDHRRGTHSVLPTAVSVNACCCRGQVMKSIRKAITTTRNKATMPTYLIGLPTITMLFATRFAGHLD